MMFFTDITTEVSNYCLLNVKQYNDKRKSNKRIVFIDPSVYELKDSNEYSCIDFLHELVKKCELNEYISIDYPCDMNFQYQDEFIEKSIKNNIDYRNFMNYICTIQFKFQDFNSFKKEFDYLYEIVLKDRPDKIVGIGNMCRIMHPNEFSDKVFKYLYQKVEKNRWIHFYGLSLKLIKRYLPVFDINFARISVDSTKWTRAVNSELKSKFGLNCKKENRNVFFLSYINEIKKIMNVEY